MEEEVFEYVRFFNAEIFMRRKIYCQKHSRDRDVAALFLAIYFISCHFPQGRTFPKISQQHEMDRVGEMFENSCKHSSQSIAALCS